MLIYLNGVFVEHNEAGIDPFDRALLLGEGVFETIRVEQGQVLFAEHHHQRMAQGARLLEIPWRMATEEWVALCQQVVDANGLSTARLRVTLTGGESGGRPLLSAETTAPTLLVFALPFDPGDLARERAEGWTAIYASAPHNHRSVLARVKSTAYVEHLVARREAVRQGASEAILVNVDGFIAEGAMTSLFAVRADGTLATPRGEDGALAGVMRRRVLELARSLDITVAECALTARDLRDAREVFATNVLVEVMPVVAIEGRDVGDGAPGAVAVALHETHRRGLERDLDATRRT